MFTSSPPCPPGPEGLGCPAPWACEQRRAHAEEDKLSPGTQVWGMRDHINGLSGGGTGGEVLRKAPCWQERMGRGHTLC